MKPSCGCCEGTKSLTPLEEANRLGLSKINFRVGTHETFLETMKSRLSSSDLPELSYLKTRDPSDPSIALLDAWATVADVLTFYQERIANEGYLQTATERRSILELGRLVGYSLRPGVTATVYLAYTLEDGYKTDILAGNRSQSIPLPGEQLQSFETSDLLKARTEWNNLKPRMTRPQNITLRSVLTIDKIYFEGIATNLKPNDRILLIFGDNEWEQAIRRVQEVISNTIDNITEAILQKEPESLAFISSSISKGLPIIEDLIETATPADLSKEIYQIYERDLNYLQKMQKSLLMDLSMMGISKEYFDNLYSREIKILGDDYLFIAREGDERVADLIKDILHPPPQQSESTGIIKFEDLIQPLLIPPSLQPVNSLHLNREIDKTFSPVSDVRPQLLLDFHSKLSASLYTAWANANVNSSDTELQTVYALRLTASLFGYNAPQNVLVLKPDDPNKPDGRKHFETEVWDTTKQHDEIQKQLFLDNAYEAILPGSNLVIQKSDGKSVTLVTKIAQSVTICSRTAYGLSARTTKIILEDDWWGDDPQQKDLTDTIRNTIVFADSDPLKLAEEPIDTKIGKNDDSGGVQIELDRLYDGLQSGRWIIVSGERTDIPGKTEGVKASELVMLSGVEQSYDPNLPGDRVHSTLILANALAYTYKRDTVSICGNVVKATHGETRSEVLGSGNSSQVLQKFQLRQWPLTYQADSGSPSGTKSTLEIRVNDVLWHETDSLDSLGPNDRNYIVKTDDSSKTTVIFGNGEKGARLPTGADNIRATYRTGIGKPGNVKEGQISLLATRPLGVKGVINPICASGGGDREERDQGRRNIPLATLALDRLVSLQDYAFFARTFAGIGKASAKSLSNGFRQLVHLTIAGADDISIDINSDLYQNLSQAVHRFGDPFQPVQIAIRELMLLVISAKVRILPDYQWELIEPKIRSALLDALSFDRRELGQSVFESEVINVIQQVEGVDFVDMELFGSINETFTEDDLKNLLEPAGVEPFVKVELARPNLDPEESDPEKRILPAQLAYLSAAVPDTLILKELIV
jgi:hypothetical protein